MAAYCDGEYDGCRVDGCNVDGCGVDGCSSDVQSQFPVCLWPLRGVAFVILSEPLRGKPLRPNLGICALAVYPCPTDQKNHRRCGGPRAH